MRRQPGIGISVLIPTDHQVSARYNCDTAGSLRRATRSHSRNWYRAWGSLPCLRCSANRMVLKVRDNSENDAERTMLMLWRMKRGAGMMAATYSNADFNFGSPSVGDPKRDRRRAIV